MHNFFYNIVSKLSCNVGFEFSFRCKKVYDGVTHAAKLYPNAYLIMILIGTLKGTYY